MRHVQANTFVLHPHSGARLRLCRHCVSVLCSLLCAPFLASSVPHGRPPSPLHVQFFLCEAPSKRIVPPWSCLD